MTADSGAVPARREQRLHLALALPFALLVLGYAAVSGIMLTIATREALAGQGESRLFVNGLPLVLAGAIAVFTLVHFLLPMLWTRVGLVVCLAAVAAMNAGMIDKHGRQVLSFDGILATALFTAVEAGGFAIPLVAGLAMWRPALLREHRSATRRTG